MLLIGGLLLDAGASAEPAKPEQYSPLPLASAAKLKPDPLPEELAAIPFQQNTALASILITSHEFDQLDAMAAGYLAKYQAQKLSADEYARWMVSLHPETAGKSALEDLRLWTTQHPQSFAAWYTLGYQLYDITLAERGGKYLRETSDPQLASMESYAGQAHAAFLKAQSVGPAQQFAADSMLIRVAPYIKHSQGILQVLAGDLSRVVKSSRNEVIHYCPATAPKNGAFARAWDEELYYFCAAYAQDPNFSRPFANLVDYGEPKWGGSFEDLEGVLTEVQQTRRTSAGQVAKMRSYLLYSEGGDALSSNEPQQAINLYLQAFDAAPSPESAWYLRWAADYAKEKTKNVDQQEQILRKATAYQPFDDRSWFELGIICETRNDMKCYMDDMVRAGDLGSTSGQNNVGYFYMVGQRGLPKDLVQAKAWLTLAANQGYKHAADKLAALDLLIKASATPTVPKTTR